MEDDDRGDYDRYTLHGVSNAKCQGRDLIQRHVRDLIVEVVEHTLGRHPPITSKYQPHIKNLCYEVQSVKKKRNINFFINECKITDLTCAVIQKLREHVVFKMTLEKGIQRSSQNTCVNENNLFDE